MRPVLDDEVLDLFVRLAGIASPTGAEREVADVVKRYLVDLGLGVHEDGSASGHRLRLRQSRRARPGAW